MIKSFFCFSLILVFLVSSCEEVNQEGAIQSSDWSVYLGSAESNQFSSLKQINKQNVNKLKLVDAFRS